MRLYFKFWKLIRVLHKEKKMLLTVNQRTSQLICQNQNSHVWTSIAVVWLQWSFRYARTDAAGKWKFHDRHIDPWQLWFMRTGGLCFAFLLNYFFAFPHFFVISIIKGHIIPTYHWIWATNNQYNIQRQASFYNQLIIL